MTITSLVCEILHVLPKGHNSNLHCISRHTDVLKACPRTQYICTLCCLMIRLCQSVSRVFCGLFCCNLRPKWHLLDPMRCLPCHAQVHLVERIPWHEALYFVTTTLTTGNLSTNGGACLCFVTSTRTTGNLHPNFDACAYCVVPIPSQSHCAIELKRVSTFDSCLVFCAHSIT